MTVNWNDVFLALLTTVGGGGVVLAAAAWLTKTLISSRFEREAEEFKIKLEANANTEIERLKNALQITADEHRVRFAKLHEDRAKRILELYQRIVEISVDCHRYVVQLGGPEPQQGFFELEKRFSELFSLFEVSKIYLPESICVLLEKAINDIRKPGISIWAYSSVNEYARHEVTMQKIEAMNTAFKAFEEQIPKAKDALAVECRKLFGVT